MASEAKSNPTTRVKSKILLISSITCIGLLVALLIAMTSWYLSNRNKINDGVFIDEMDVSRLSIGQVREIIDDHSKDLKEKFSITLRCMGKEWIYKHDDIGLDLDVEGALKQAHMKGREGSIFIQLAEATGLKDRESKNVETRFIYDRDKLRAKLYEIKNLVDREPVDSRLDFLPDEDEKFIITAASNGVYFDIEAIENILDMALNNKQLKVNIEYEPEILKPKIDSSFYEGKTELIASYNTDLGNSSENRIHNVLLSAEAFNGLCVEPGQLVSFNDTVGNTTLENGYRLAPVIQYDKSLKDAAGGGVCQTATTLYNAVLLANLEVVESSRHSFPTSYAPKGLDATVYMSEPYIDLKFRNTRDNPIYIASYYRDNKIYFDIYGEPLKDNIQIKLRTEEYETLDPPEPEYIEDTEGKYVVYEGETFEKVKARQGYKVRVYKDTYKGDRLIQSDILYDHFYQPIRGVIYIGTKTDRFIPQEKQYENQNEQDNQT